MASHEFVKTSKPFKSFNLSPLFLPRDAGEDEGGGLNGAGAVERFERFELV
jgi:hypothetical protein